MHRPSAAPGRCRRVAGLQCLARPARRIAARPVGQSRRGLRVAAARAHRAAFRSRHGRSAPRADHREHQPGRPASRFGGGPDADGNAVRRPCLCRRSRRHTRRARRRDAGTSEEAGGGVAVAQRPYRLGSRRHRRGRTGAPPRPFLRSPAHGHAADLAAAMGAADQAARRDRRTAGAAEFGTDGAARHRAR